MTVNIYHNLAQRNTAKKDNFDLTRAKRTIEAQEKQV